MGFQGGSDDKFDDGTTSVKVYGTDDTPIGNVADAVKVHITNAGSGGTAQQDKTTFTEGTTTFTPVGGVYNETPGAAPTEDQAAAARITANRAIHSNLRNASGTEIATLSNPVRIDPTGTTVQPISASSLPLPSGAATESTLSTLNSKFVTGTDIGDVTVNNGSGASAVNIQDGGNIISVDTTQLPGSLVSGRLDTNTGAWLGSTAPTIGQKTSANSLPVTVASDQPPITITQAASENATFVLYAFNIQIGNNKSMVSLLNAASSGVILRITSIRILNVRTTAVTGVVSDFRLLRMTGHSAGTTLTPESYDTSDTLDAGVTARTGATISGEAATPLNRWLKSSDEWGVGALDTEGIDQAIDQVLPLYRRFDQIEKNITLREGQGLTIKHVVNSTNGAFDLFITFTQEPV